MDINEGLKYLNDIIINTDFAVEQQKLKNLKNKYITKTKASTNTVSKAVKTNNKKKLEKNVSGITETDSSSTSTASSSKDILENVSNTNRAKKTTKISKKFMYDGVIVKMDAELLTTYGQEIINQLEILEINCKISNHIYPNLITWTYINVDETEMDEEFHTILVILNWQEVINYVSTNSLVQHIKSVSEMLSDKRIILGLYGFENYFKYWKSQKNIKKPGKSNDKKFSEYKNSTSISRYDLEYALTELELKFSYCHRFLENTQDIVDLIGQFTKSIAQLPEKEEKNAKYKNFDFCVMKDCRDCVLVDKNGNGFRRLWQQQLTTFEMVRLETAEAVISKYETPAQLFDAYDSCSSQTEGSQLLEDIPIRRAAGPLTNSRKIGPDLSNKVYNFFNASDGNIIL